MKKLLVLCFSLHIFNTQAVDISIINYEASYKNVVMEIVFQDPYKFFCGSDAVSRGFITDELFISENKKGIESILGNPLQIKKVLINDEKKVIGFIEFCKSKELSLESLKSMIESQGLLFDENQLLAIMPYLKRTDMECEELILIECLAVSKEFRRKGYGRTLIKFALQEITKEWPDIKQVRLNVNATNQIARNLYASEGFVESSIQPVHLAIMNVIQYEKSLI